MGSLRQGLHSRGRAEKCGELKLGFDVSGKLSKCLEGVINPVVTQNDYFICLLIVTHI